MPPIVALETRMCRQYAADLTVGCSFGCVYCPFSDQKARHAGVQRPTVVELSSIHEQPAPPHVFLSSASDAFAPQAAPQTQRLLEHWLPRGTIVGIVTKGIVPQRTLDLLAEFRSQVEGVSVGVASLRDDRNRVLEPGCPPARERLANIERLAARGLPVALRADPLFPTLDDDPAALRALVEESARRGVQRIMTAYVIAWGRYLRRLRREPLLSESCRLLSERTPMAGGSAFSAPLARKLETYSLVSELARAQGVDFNTCGCRDLRLVDVSGLETSCRNLGFFRERGLPLPADGCGDPGPRGDEWHRVPRSAPLGS